MSPPAHHRSSRSPVHRKRKSSSSDDSSDEKHRSVKSKKHVHQHHSSKDDFRKPHTSDERRSMSRSSSRPNLEEDKWKKINEQHSFIRPADCPSTSRRDEGHNFLRPADRSGPNRREDGGFFRDRRSQSRSFHRDRHHVSVEDEFMDHRRHERENITMIGVEHVWGKSPTRAEE